MTGRIRFMNITASIFMGSSFATGILAVLMIPNVVFGDDDPLTGQILTCVCVGTCPAGAPPCSLKTCTDTPPGSASCQNCGCSEDPNNSSVCACQ